MEHLLKYAELQPVAVDDAAIKSLGAADKTLANRVKEAFDIADQHNVSMLITVKEYGEIKYVPVGHKDDAPLDLTESIVLAVELHHIFKNNPKVSRLSVKSGRRTTYTYMYAGFIAKEPHVSIIILDSKGRFLTSYDPKREALYPEVHNMSAKPYKACDGIIADTLDSLLKRFKAHIEEEREDEESSEE